MRDHLMIAVATLDAQRRLQWSDAFSHDKHRWRVVRLARLALIKRFARRDEAARRNKISRFYLGCFKVEFDDLDDDRQYFHHSHCANCQKCQICQESHDCRPSC